MADALMKGDIDAALAWRPFISRLQKLLGNNAVTLEDDSIYKMNWIIAGDQAFVHHILKLSKSFCERSVGPSATSWRIQQSQPKL